MAISVTQIGHAFVTSAASVSVTLSAAVPAGALIAVAYLDTAVYGAGSVQDAAGNAYLQNHTDVNGAPTSGTAGLFWSQDCLAVNNNTTLTYTSANGVTNSAIEIIVFYVTGLNPGLGSDGFGPSDEGTLNAAGGSSTDASVTGGAASYSGDLNIGVVGVPSSTTIFAPSSPWAGFTSPYPSKLGAYWQVNSGTAGLDFNPSLAGSVPWASFIIGFIPFQTPTVYPSGISSTSGVGRPVFGLSAKGFANTSAFGSPIFGLAPFGFGSVTALGAPIFSLNPHGIASITAIGTTDVSLNPHGIVSTTALGVPTPYRVLSPSGIASATALGHAIASLNTVGIPSTTALGNPIFSLNTAGIPSTTAIGIPDPSLCPAGIATKTVMGAPLLGLAALPALLVNVSQFGAPTFLPGVVTLFPNGVPRFAVFGAPSVGYPLVPALLQNTSALGAPIFSSTLAPAGLASTTGVGVHAAGYNVPPLPRAWHFQMRLLRSLHRIYDKAPQQSLAFQINLSGGVTWTIDGDYLTVTRPGASDVVLQLHGWTIQQIIGQLQATGIDVLNQAQLSLLELDATLLLVGNGNAMLNNGGNLYAYTSLLWGWVDAVARWLGQALADITVMLEQMTIPGASGWAVDYWGSFFGVSRNTGEEDLPYQAAIIWEPQRPRNNPFAAIANIRKLLGEIVVMREPWKQMLRLDVQASRINAPNGHLPNSVEYCYHTQQLVSQEWLAPADWQNIMAQAEEDRPSATVWMVPPYVWQPIGLYVAPVPSMAFASYPVLTWMVPRPRLDVSMALDGGVKMRKLATMGFGGLPQTLAPAGVASATAVGALAPSLNAAGIARTVNLGQPTATGGMFTQTLKLRGIASTTVLGAAVADATPAGIINRSIAGRPIFSLNATGIPTTTVYGNPRVTQTFFPFFP